VIYILDTHAWIEYVKGSKLGEKVKKLFQKKNSKFVTMECCLAELFGYSYREKRDFNELYRLINQNSYIFPVLREHWLSAGKIKAEMRKKRQGFGLIDAILLAKQRELKCKLVSGDPHFKGLKNIVFLE